MGQLLELIKDPETRTVVIGLTLITGVMLGVKYYHEIRLARLRISQLESQGVTV